MAGKQRTLDQVEAMQAKAVRFLRDVVGDAERSEDFASMSPYEYAENKGVEIVERNPARYALVIAGRGRRMSMNKRMLERRIAELEEQNEDLQSPLDSVPGIVQPEADDDDEDGDDDENEDDSDDDEDDDRHLYRKAA